MRRFHTHGDLEGAQYEFLKLIKPAADQGRVTFDDDPFESIEESSNGGIFARPYCARVEKASGIIEFYPVGGRQTRQRMLDLRGNRPGRHRLVEGVLPEV